MHACTKGGDANRKSGSFTRKQSERNFAMEREKSLNRTHHGWVWRDRWMPTHHTPVMCERREFWVCGSLSGVMVPDGSWCGAHTLMRFPSRKAISLIRILLPHNESLSINTHQSRRFSLTRDRDFLGHFILFLLAGRRSKIFDYILTPKTTQQESFVCCFTTEKRIIQRQLI